MPVIKFENVSAGYGKKQVLRGVSVSLERGRLISIIGPNGCGKSTLLKTAVGILSPTIGRITADGEDIGSLPHSVTARKIAYLAQGRAVPEMTVEQLVLHGRFPYLSYPRIYSSRDRDIAEEAMARMGIAEFSQMRLSSLSGGMRQNAYIAMALTQGADYMLLDEPTTYLDIAGRLRLMQTLKSLASSGKGITAVLHDLPLAMELSDELVVMRDGEIITVGAPEQIYKSGVIKDVFGVALCRTEAEHGFAYYYDRGAEIN